MPRRILVPTFFGGGGVGNYPLKSKFKGAIRCSLFSVAVFVWLGSSVIVYSKQPAWAQPTNEHLEDLLPFAFKHFFDSEVLRLAHLVLLISHLNFECSLWP